MAQSAQPEFLLSELIDLALCSPEVGAVNFNVIRKLGFEQLEPVPLNDIEAHQIQVISRSSIKAE